MLQLKCILPNLFEWESPARSQRRPGVATTSCDLASDPCCSFSETPPYTHAARTPAKKVGWVHERWIESQRTILHLTCGSRLVFQNGEHPLQLASIFVVNPCNNSTSAKALNAPRDFPKRTATVWICMTSSRVGATINAVGAASLDFLTISPPTRSQWRWGCLQADRKNVVDVLDALT